MAKTATTPKRESFAASESPHSALPLVALLAAVGVIAAVTALVLLLRYRDTLDLHGRQLQTVAELRAQQVVRWLDERLRQAEFVRGSELLAGLSGRAALGDAAAVGTLLDQAANLRKAYGNQSVLVLDAQAGLLASTAGVAVQKAQLRPSTRQRRLRR